MRTTLPIPMLLKTILLAALLGASGMALALNKCDSGGKITYTGAPCPSGSKATVVDTADPVTPADSATARQRAAQERIELKRMQGEQAKSAIADARHRKHSRAETKSSLRHQQKCGSLQLRKKWAEEDVARAPLKSRQKAETRARRVAEKFALECGKG
jgi:hypothetical protein